MYWMYTEYACKNPGYKQIIKPLQRPASDCNELNRGVDPATAIHYDSNDKRDVSNTFLTPKSEEKPPLPCVVSSRINRGDSSQVTKPEKIPQIESNVALRTVWKLVQALMISVSESEKIVLQILEMVGPELDKLLEQVSVLSNCVQSVLCKSEEKAKIAQGAGSDVSDVRVIIQETEVAARTDASGNDITTENIVQMVADMMSIVQDVKKV